MPTIAVWSKYTGKAWVMAFAVHDNGLARVFYQVRDPYSSKAGEFVTTPIKLPAEGFPEKIATANLQLDIFGLVSKGPADFRFRELKIGGYEEKASTYVETKGDHKGFAFMGTVKELYWTDKCLLGTGEEIYLKLMGTQYGSEPPVFPGAPMPRARQLAK
ncbi:MAG: hypothetical protein K2W96_11575 [Gemmataceae bacterium]|nr:hypothetical protein [Gemmataceae bacterium]